MSFMDSLKIGAFKRLYLAEGAEWRPVNIFGIRNTEPDTKDQFNDWIGVVSEDDLKIYPGTTDPSVYWTQNPMSYAGVTGAAHLLEGYYKKIWMIGIHAPGTAFAHEALIGAHGKIKFWRDVNKNQVYDPKVDVIQENYNDIIWIDLHYAGFGDPSQIGRYSAGCQVIQHHTDFAEFMKIVKASGEKLFSYVLFNIKDF